MSTVRDIEKFFDEVIPKELAESWDNDGAIICTDGAKEIKKILIALDVTSGAIERAEAENADMIISHHPLIFEGPKKISDNNGVGIRIIKAIKANLSLLAYHTRLDAAAGGVNDKLAEALGVKKTSPFGSGLGRIFTLEKEESYESFKARVSAALGGATVTGIKCRETVKTVALIGGSGKSFLREVLESGADTFLSGELNYSTQLEAREMILNTVCGTHYETEAVVLPYIESLIHERFPEIKTEIYYEKAEF